MDKVKASELTIQLLEHTLYGARAAAAGHSDVEFIVVFRHLVEELPRGRVLSG